MTHSLATRQEASPLCLSTQGRRKAGNFEKGGKETHDAMNNSVFSEQDDLSRGTNQPLQLLFAAVEIQIVHCTTQCIRVGDSHILVLSGIQFDGASFYEGMLEVANEIL
jgi:hypothetical protein